MGSDDHIRVVLVSPSDVPEERAAAQRVIDELNRGVAEDRLALWRWETDARPGLHREGAQGLIDELMDLEDAEIVVGVFWKRFGAAARDGGSGTEHELRKAWASWRQRGRPDVMVYFSDRAYAPKAPAEALQWASVLEFQAALPAEQLWWTYTSSLDFERLLREHLTRYLQSAPGFGGWRASRRPDRPASDRVYFNVPPVAVAFSGRERELAQLEAALGVTDRAVVTTAIAGLGGVGKSQLAARYAELRARDYDIVAWIGAEDGGTADLADLAARLGVAAPGLAPGTLAVCALEELARTSRSWLLVLDNVQSPEQLAALRPPGGHGRLLATSRDRGLSRCGQLITVGVFDEDTATAYLTERADRPGDEIAARRLARALGCLPLALSHAAAYCELGTSFADYQELLDGLPARELFDRHPELSYTQTVASTWKPSMQAANRMAPLARDVVEMAACLAPDAIPKSVFARLVDDDSVAQRKRLMDAFGALARYSLATVDDDSISVHRLLQKTVRDDGAARGVPAAWSQALAAIDESFPENPDLPRDWPVCERLLPHARALADSLDDPGEHSVRLIRLLNRACWYLNRSEPGGRGRAVAEDVLEHAERLLGDEHPDTLDARDHLAGACQWSERTADAIAILEPLAAIRERTQGAEHPDTLKSRRRLGDAYQWAERFADAIAIYEPLAAASERIMGAEHPDTLTTRHSLAHAYAMPPRNHDAHRIDDAIAILEPLVAIRGRVLGAEHPDTLTTRQILGLAYLWNGKLEEAIAILEPLLADRERILGAEHAATVITGQLLGISYQHSGRIAQAIALFEALLADCGRIRGGGRRQTLHVRHHLADAYLAAGRTDEAIYGFEALLPDCEADLGAQDSHTLSTRHSLAVAYDAAGRAADAARLRARP